MRANDLLIRTKDSEIFKVVDVSHWSLITSTKPLSTEETRVKWIGGNQFVGHDGNGYQLKDAPEP